MTSTITVPRWLSAAFRSASSCLLSPEPGRATEEVRGTLARTAAPRQLHHLLRVDAHLVERIDDAFRDGVVPATGAQRGLATFINLRLEADPVHLDWCRRHLNWSSILP